MKKFIIALAAAIAAFGFTSCKKDADQTTADHAIVGTWKATKMEMSIGNMTQEIELSEMGGEIEFTFENDGTGYVAAFFDGEKLDAEMTYTVSGNMLSMTVEGDTVTYPFKVDGNHMALEFDEEFIEIEGARGFLHFEKQ